MKITLGELKSVINESIAPPAMDKIASTVEGAMESVDKYVASLVAGERDKGAAADVKDALERVESMSKWMATHKERAVAPMSRFSSELAEFVKNTGFWKTPVFLGRNEHVEDVKTMANRVKRAYLDFVVALGESGARLKRVSSVPPASARRAITTTKSKRIA